MTKIDERLRIVMVTGGSGLVGRCLQKEVLDNTNLVKDKKFIFLSSQDGDLTDFETAKSLFEKHKPDCLIHLAAKVGGLYANMTDKSRLFYHVNTKLNENVLRLSFESGVQRVLSCLSTCIFPNDCINYPLDESMVHLSPPHESNYDYAMAKRQIDSLNEMYNKQLENSDRLFYSIIPTNIYGPYDNFHLKSSHVIPGLIHRAYLHCMQHFERSTATTEIGAPVCLPVYGSGKPLRQFIYAQDLAKLILWSLEEFNDKIEPRIILCPGDGKGDYCEQSVGHAAELICGIFNKKFKINLQPVYDVSKSDGQFKKTATNKKLLRLKPEFEFTKLEIGLRHTIDWFCSEYPRIRITSN